jgi:hypothetical protein
MPMFDLWQSWINASLFATEAQCVRWWLTCREEAECCYKADPARNERAESGLSTPYLYYSEAARAFFGTNDALARSLCDPHLQNEK